MILKRKKPKLLQSGIIVVLLMSFLGGCASENGHPRDTKHSMERFPNTSSDGDFPNTRNTIARAKSQDGNVSNGATNTHIIVLDPVANVSFQLFWEMDDLDLVLIDPNGNRIDPSVAQSDPDIRHEVTQVFDDFQTETYFVQSPTPGSWMLEVTGANVTSSSGESYTIHGFIEGSAFTFSAHTNLSFYRNADPIQISAEVKENGAPVTDATVVATVTLPNESTQTVALFDDEPMAILLPMMAFASIPLLIQAKLARMSLLLQLSALLVQPFPGNQ